ncbi:hypothetical protein DOZ91_12005 [Peribacillus frigoritolerans]|nr:hypothetical protein DOZ91_12005 [Peribacillus frigoritolerans]
MKFVYETNQIICTILIQARSLGLRLDHNQLDYILHPFTLFNKWAIFFRNSFNDEFVSVFETFKRFMKQQILINCKEGGLPHSAALQMKHFQPQLFAWFS